jgi:hypothetical protein
MAYLDPSFDLAAEAPPACMGMGIGGAGARCTPPDSLCLDGSMGSSYLDMDSMFASGCGHQSAKNFLVPDELPSPLDGSGARGGPRGGAGGHLLGHAAPAMLPPSGLLPLDDDLAAARHHLHHHHMHAGPPGAAALLPPASAFSDATAACAGAAGLYSSSCLQSAAQQRRLYQLVLLSPETGEPVRQATEDDAVEVARLLESESGSSGALSTAGGSLPRALSFVGGAAHCGGDGDGEEVGGGGGRDQEASAKRQRTGKGGAHGAAGGGAPQARAPPPKPVAEKRTGPCHHCGVDESPQWWVLVRCWSGGWLVGLDHPQASTCAQNKLTPSPPPPCTPRPTRRRGPPGKPILCNACGMKWKRGRTF